MKRVDQEMIFEGYVKTVVGGKPAPTTEKLITEAASLQLDKSESVVPILEGIVNSTATEARKILKSIKEKQPDVLIEMVSQTMQGKYGDTLKVKLHSKIQEVGNILKREKK